MAQAGIATIRVGSKQLSAKGNINVLLQEFERSVEVDNDGKPHVKKMRTVCFVEGTFYLRDSDDVNEIEAAAEGVSVTVAIAGGRRTGVLREATLVGTVPVNSEEGTFTARWEGVGRWNPIQA